MSRFCQSVFCVILFLFLFSCKTSKVIVTKQRLYDTLDIYGYQNKTLGFEMFMWGGFEFDSSYTDKPQMAKLYTEYDLISLSHFPKKAKRVFYMYYFATGKIQLLCLALPLEKKLENKIVKLKQYVKDQSYTILSDTIFNLSTHPIYVLKYDQIRNNDIFHYSEFYVNTKTKTICFLYFSRDSDQLGRFDQASEKMTRSFHWIGEANFYDFSKELPTRIKLR